MTWIIIFLRKGSREKIHKRKSLWRKSCKRLRKHRRKRKGRRHLTPRSSTIWILKWPMRMECQSVSDSQKVWAGVISSKEMLHRTNSSSSSSRNVTPNLRWLRGRLWTRMIIPETAPICNKGPQQTSPDRSFPFKEPRKCTELPSAKSRMWTI